MPLFFLLSFSGDRFIMKQTSPFRLWTGLFPRLLLMIRAHAVGAQEVSHGIQTSPPEAQPLACDPAAAVHPHRAVLRRGPGLLPGPGPESRGLRHDPAGKHPRRLGRPLRRGGGGPPLPLRAQAPVLDHPALRPGRRQRRHGHKHPGGRGRAKRLCIRRQHPPGHQIQHQREKPQN